MRPGPHGPGSPSMLIGHVAPAGSETMQASGKAIHDSRRPVTDDQLSLACGCARAWPSARLHARADVYAFTARGVFVRPGSDLMGASRFHRHYHMYFQVLTTNG